MVNVYTGAQYRKMSKAIPFTYIKAIDDKFNLKKGSYFNLEGKRMEILSIRSIEASGLLIKITGKCIPAGVM